MPRVKRPLAEVDANASRPLPSAKRAKSQRAAADRYGSKGKEELAAMLRKRNLPHTGTKRVLIQRLEESSEAVDGESDELPHPKVASPPNIPRRRSGRHGETNDNGNRYGADSSQEGGTSGVRELREEQEHNAGKTRVELDPGTAQERSNATMDYTMKDNSKLQTLLSCRGLFASGTREEMITQLEHSADNYEDLSSVEITEMLKQRHLKMASSYTKDVKIKRLRLNDELDQDAGNFPELQLNVELSITEEYANEAWVAKEREEVVKRYASSKVDRLLYLLKERKLPLGGAGSRGRNILIERLREDDRNTLEKKYKKYKMRYDVVKADLEARTGHPVSGVEGLMGKKANSIDRRDIEIQMNVEPKRSEFPTCDYDWTDSRWASKDTRALRQICKQRGMPGWGKKATMIKFLETGSLDYEDLDVTPLEQMCTKRGLRPKSATKKIDLVRLLRVADEEGIAMEHSLTFILKV